MFIYKTTNINNGKIYIGQSIFNPEERLNYLGSGVKIKEEIKKLGKENFKREIIQDGISDTKTLNELEIYWISHYDSTNPEVGYNILKGGSYENKSQIIKESFKHPDRIKKKSIESKRNWEDDNYRNKVKESNSKTWANPDLIKNHSERMKEIFSDKKYKETLSCSLRKMEKLECPHCKNTLPKNHAISKHFDNCIYHTDLEKRKIAIERWNYIKDKTKKIECPHCNLSGSVGNMNRWHFDNCKKNNFSK